MGKVSVSSVKGISEGAGEEDEEAEGGPPLSDEEEARGMNVAVDAVASSTRTAEETTLIPIAAAHDWSSGSYQLSVGVALHLRGRVRRDTGPTPVLVPASRRWHHREQPRDRKETHG
jgi:hypothetical protein